MQNEKVTHSLHEFKRSLTARAAARKSANATERLRFELSAAEHEELSFTSEIDLVVEAEDIKDELHILKAVLDDQRQSMKQLESFLEQARTKVDYVNYKEDSSNLVDYSCIDIQMHRITEMNELVERALSSVCFELLAELIALPRKPCSLINSDFIQPLCSCATSST